MAAVTPILQLNKLGLRVMVMASECVLLSAIVCQMLWVMASVTSGRHNRTPQTAWLKQEFISECWRPDPRAKVLVDSAPGESPLPACRCLPSCRVLARHSQLPLIGTLIPSWDPHPHDLIQT